MASKITYKSKRSTDKSYPHTDVFIDGIYIGYYMVNTSKFASRYQNWDFVGEGAHIKDFYTRTRKELTSILESAATIPKLPKGWMLEMYSCNMPDRFFGKHYEGIQEWSKCVIRNKLKVITPMHGWYGEGSKDVQKLAKELGYKYTESIAKLLYGKDE